MADRREIEVKITGNARELKNATSQANKSLNNLGGSAKKLGGVLAGAFAGTALIAGLKSSITKIAEFEATMRRVALISGGSEKALTSLARTLGGTTSFTAKQAGDAMTFLAQAGFKTNEILDATPGILQLAGSTMIDLATAADIASNILSGFGIEASRINEINDILVTTTNNANTNVYQFGEAFRVVGPIAKGAGLSINEVAAAIGVLGDAGIQGSLAGTQLKVAISQLINPNEEAAATLEKLGVETKGAGGQLRPLGDIFRDLGRAGMTAEEAFAIFEQRAASGALVIANTTDKLYRLTEQTKEGGVAADQYAGQMNTLQGDLKATASAWDDLILQGGNWNGALREIVQATTNLIMLFNSGYSQALVDAKKKVLDYVPAMNAAILAGEKLSATEKMLWDDTIAAIRVINEHGVALEDLGLSIQKPLTEEDKFLKKLKEAREAGEKAKKAVQDQTIAQLAAAKAAKDAADAKDPAILASKAIEEAMLAEAIAVEIAKQEWINYMVARGGIVESPEVTSGDAAPDPIDTFIPNPDDVKSRMQVLENILKEYSEKRKKRKEEEKQFEANIDKELKDEKIAIAVAGLAAASNIATALTSMQRSKMNEELKAAGDNEKKKEEIRRKYAKKDQAIAILQSIINTALGVTSALATANVPLAIAIGAAGAIQTGVIASQQFARGTSFFGEGGMALVGERGPEVVNLPRGASVTPNHLIGSGGGTVINVSGFVGNEYELARQINIVLANQGNNVARTTF